MDVLHTVEIRWFQPGPVPATVQAWFEALGPRVEPEARTDRYLVPASDGLGVKLREGAVEPKRRTARLGPLQAGACEGTVEAWAKWSFPRSDDGVPGDGWVEVAKTRRQRHRQGCALEVSEVRVLGTRWWSVCLEATGSDDDARRAALVDGARQWLARDDAPALPDAAARGYPAWLREVAG